MAIPGVSGGLLGAPEPLDAALAPSSEVLAVVDAVVRLVRLVRLERRELTVVAGAQALVDAQALLDVERRGRRA